ncbi:MAG: hypothetical protein KC917_02720 [Candidatus Omnitrophica bacterium]|nr:hypothetical protein [Candidatus Omnitrophota bacterium]MCB9782940.1 hypothetical protein [Candidatus Omnitrophota bacterium]
MASQCLSFVLVFLLSLNAALDRTATAQEVEPASPLPQRSLMPMLRIDWTRGPNLPQGFQDSDGGILENRLITVCGFCSGGLDRDNQEKPGVYPRGFLQKGWSIDLSNGGTWEPIPDFPGDARQGLSAARVGDALFFWGGFSYTEPYCYRNGWRLSLRHDGWKWDPLPDYPWPIASAAMVTIGTKIYSVGGADYNAEAFFTDTDRSGTLNHLGARFLVLDTDHLEAGWKELARCPGTPRWVHAAAAVDGDIYVIGGATGNTVRDGTNYGYCTVVDNWKYDPKTSTWTRIRDLPISSGNFPRSTNLVFDDRYLILPGGYQYGSVLTPEDDITQPYGTTSHALPEHKSGLCNDVFVYDTQRDLFGTADKLPMDNNVPMTVVQGDEIYLLGGETGGGVVEGEYYGHHPDLFLKGMVRKIHPGTNP